MSRAQPWHQIIRAYEKLALNENGSMFSNTIVFNNINDIHLLFPDTGVSY